MGLLCPVLVVTWSFVLSVSCRTIFLELLSPTNEERAFMKQYGYLPDGGPGVDMSYTPQSISEAVRKIQAYGGLPTTGVLDQATRELMQKKRCGMKDIETESSRSRRYILQKGWNKSTITYRVINGSSTLAKSRVEELMAAGLAVWAPHSGLRFTRLDGDQHADIEVSFVTLDHGDGSPFDGLGRVVAHAFPPPHGAMHFDDDELWTDDPNYQDEELTDFFAVAVHEIGHALGLSHSEVKASVMYPYYQAPVDRLQLDDILGMRELYLKESPSELSVVTESPATAPHFTKANDVDDDDIPDLCYTNYDTIQVIHGMIYVFEEEWVWVLRERKSIEPGFPRRIHHVFRGLPDRVQHVRTVYEKLNGNVVIFYEKRYWEFDHFFRLVKKGRLSDYSIPSQVTELSTAFLSNYNNKTYLIDYERFWRYDEATGTMDKGYPKEMSAWRDVPYPVDSAMVWRGDTYFFHGPRFWRFDNTQIRAHDYYPLPTAQIWFPCARSSDMDHYVYNEP